MCDDVQIIAENDAFGLRIVLRSSKIGPVIIDPVSYTHLDVYKRQDQKRVDYMPILERAVKAGYQSVMVDGKMCIRDRRQARE